MGRDLARVEVRRKIDRPLTFEPRDAVRSPAEPDDVCIAVYEIGDSWFPVHVRCTAKGKVRVLGLVMMTGFRSMRVPVLTEKPQPFCGRHLKRRYRTIDRRTLHA